MIWGCIEQRATTSCVERRLPHAPSRRLFGLLAAWTAGGRTRNPPLDGAPGPLHPAARRRGALRIAAPRHTYTARMSPKLSSAVPSLRPSATHIRLGLVLATAGLCLSLATATAIGSQDSPAQPAGAQADSTKESDDAAAVPQGELDQMLAGIALHPHELLSQVLMASTYPLEIVQADRWASANKELKGDALTAALEKQEWDPSVKSLINFPDVLASLSENLTWTQKIGDAFLADQKSVLETVQKLRHKAKEAGNLESSEQMTITTETVKDEDAEADASKEIEVIVIKSADPEVIYVPAYNPVVVYGTWWYPTYPPPVYYRPPYYHSGVAIAFGVGIVYGMAWGYAWGGCRWGHHHVNVNINRNVNINANINRNRYKTQGGGGRGSNGAWKHNPEHRKGVQYRDNKTASKYGGKSNAQAQRSRDSYRGRAEKDRSQLSKDRASGRIDSSGRERSDSRTNDRSGSGSSDRSTNSQSNRSQGTSRSGGRSGAFGDSSRGGSASRDSARGKSSRSRSSGGRSSGGRSSGGRSRGGGGGGRR